MIVEGKRYEGFQAMRVRHGIVQRNPDAWYVRPPPFDVPPGNHQAQLLKVEGTMWLEYTKPGFGKVRIHSPGSASSIGELLSDNSYPVSFAKLTPEEQAFVRTCVTQIRAQGDPVDNDESIYA